MQKHLARMLAPEPTGENVPILFHIDGKPPHDWILYSLTK